MEEKISLLVADDDAGLRGVLVPFLEKEGFAVTAAVDGEEAEALTRSTHPALLVLDIEMPKLDGLSLCRRLREAGVKTPIIILTARDDEVTKLTGLETGADDYLVKPFSMRELAARIRAVLRRTSRAACDAALAPAPVATAGSGIRLDRESHTATIAGRELALTPIEFTLLDVFLAHPGEVLSRLQLMEHTHGFAFPGYERTIDAHIRNLRKKIEPDTKEPTYIKTIYGVGYKYIGKETS